MDRIIDINWGGLKKVGDKFLEQSEEISSLAKEIDKTFNEVGDAWNGIPTENFINNSKSVVGNLVKEKLFLEVWYEFLTKSSMKYNGNFEEALSRIKSLESEFGLEEVDYYE